MTQKFQKCGGGSDHFGKIPEKSTKLLLDGFPKPVSSASSTTNTRNKATAMITIVFNRASTLTTTMTLTTTITLNTTTITTLVVGEGDAVSESYNKELESAEDKRDSPWERMAQVVQM